MSEFLSGFVKQIGQYYEFKNGLRAFDLLSLTLAYWNSVVLLIDPSYEMVDRIYVTPEDNVLRLDSS